MKFSFRNKMTSFQESSFLRGRPVTHNVPTEDISTKPVSVERKSSKRDGPSAGPVAVGSGGGGGGGPMCRRTPSYSSAASSSTVVELSPWHVKRVETSRQDSVKSSASKGTYTLMTEL